MTVKNLEVDRGRDVPTNLTASLPLVDISPTKSRSLLRFHFLTVAILILSCLVYPNPSTASSTPPPFLDVAAESGLSFTHFNGMTGDFHFPEMTGQGAAFFDYDNDGDLDVYLVQGAMLDSSKPPSETLFPYSGKGMPRDRLFRNDLLGSSGNKSLANSNSGSRFTDVTDESGIKSFGYGMGVATGDFNNDGWIDLYVTNYGSNLMLQNNGNGTFSDVTSKTQTGDDRWSTSASFVDYDRDGWLDLYVTNYVQYSVSKKIECFAKSSRRDYCGPSGFTADSDRLFHNRGNGTFEDVTAKSGVGRVAGAGLGVATADFDGDQWPDLYVANDGQPNFLFLNQRDGTFRDDALFAGVAVNREGKPEASMGVYVADHDHDGDQDIFLTHLAGETNTLYVNDGSGLFEDRTVETGLGAGSLPSTSFGTGWLDVDTDGWLDLVIANGAVRTLETLARKGDLYPLDQPNQLFRNLGNGRYRETSAEAGNLFSSQEVSRGMAIGDFDNDGDADLLMTNNNGPARLMRNTSAAAKPWIGLRLLTGKPGRDALGATVKVELGNGQVILRRVTADGSYASAHDPRVLFYLGASPKNPGKIDSLEVLWPDGKREIFPAPRTHSYVTLHQGTGTPAKAEASEKTSQEKAS
ncbi:MAG: CRTAC1 family protein [Deltaproteobacteria bacterium]|nr:CRTAC1 family protein [Deltaproteobacteria bacterium]